MGKYFVFLSSIMPPKHRLKYVQEFAKKGRQSFKLGADEDIQSDDEGANSGEESSNRDYESEEEVEETAEEKRRRLAKEYLSSFDEKLVSSEEKSAQYDVIAEKLTRDRLELQGKLFT